MQTQKYLRWNDYKFVSALTLMLALTLTLTLTLPANTCWPGKLNSDPYALREFGLPNITNDALAALECCFSADVGLSDGGTHFALEIMQC